MTIALVTANVGGFDKEHFHVKQSIDYNHYSYTDFNLPRPLSGLNNRMKAKYCKIQSHEFLQEDIIIWIDGSFEIKSDIFIEDMIQGLYLNDIVLPLHPKRPNAYEEMNFLIDCLKDCDKYISDRYKGINFESELHFYMRNYFPVEFPLYACGVFARKNNSVVNSFFNDWWSRSIEFSEFDQGLFSFEAFRHELKIKSFPFSDLDKWLNRYKHESD